MFIAIGATFGAFWVWRVIGARLIARGRRQSATGYQALGVTVFLTAFFLGTQVSLDEIVPRGSQLALFLLAFGVVPLVCGLLAAAFVIGWVFMLPPLAPRAIDKAPNPFGK
jgi:hypothetical protein